MDANEAHLDTALELGIIDAKGDERSIREVDILFLTIPVDAAVNTLPGILDIIEDETIIIDAGSTKALICSTC